MKRLLLAALIALSVAATAGAQGTVIGVHVVSSDATTVTLGWTVPAGTASQHFKVNGTYVSFTRNTAQNTARFTKSTPCFGQAGCYVIEAQAILDTGSSSGVDEPPPPPKPQCSDGLDNDGDTRIDYPADPGCTSSTDTTEAPDPPPPGNNLTVTDRTWVCSGTVNYNLVKVTVSGNLARTDAVRIASGCNGTIQRLEVDTANADGIHIGAGAHDVTINGGYVHSSGVCGSCGSVHVDGIQALGGQRITMRNLDVNYPTATNSALYINQGSGGQDRPTDVVCDGCTFRRSPDKNRVVRIGDSLRSGIRNSIVYWCGTGPTCDAPTAPAIWFNGLQTDPVNENNTLLLAS